MRLTLRLPGLLLPRQALLDTVAGLELPVLSRLLGRGRMRRGAPQGHYDDLARDWHMETLPAAALRLLGDGGAPGAEHWICLDPVHLRVHRRGVTLADPAGLALSIDEDEALRATLGPLFADFGALRMTRPGHWYLPLDPAAELVTAALPDAAGRPVDPALPAGADGPRWRRLLVEAQTLLGCHEANRAREAAGRPVVNSLWPWGPGRLAVRPAAPCDLVWSDDPVVRGLGLAAGIQADSPPRRFGPAAGNILAVLDDLAGPARELDALAWSLALERIERDWLAPALDALRRGRLSALHLAASGPEQTLDIEFTRIDALKIWRRPAPPARLAA